MKAPVYSCAICRIVRQPGEPWLLVVEKRWEDKVRVLEWEERLAGLPGVQCACSPFHVQQLVVHWMTTGALSYPMAHLEPGPKRILLWPKFRRTRGTEADPGIGRPVSELSVHRGSLNRILEEQPEALLPVLEALVSGLRKTGPSDGEAVAGRNDESVTELLPCPQ
jgi:hypothetical protein